MKIKAEKWIIDEDTSFKILEIKKCCDKLVNSKNIDLNNEYYDCDDVKYSVKLFKIIEDEFGDCDYDYDEFETINYCPFCGNPISIEIVNTIDKTKEYESLRKEREISWDKCKNIDSIKEKEILIKQVKEIDNRINNMLTSDNFDCYLAN